MADKVTLENFSNAISRMLEDYTEEVSDKIKIAIDEVTNEAYADLRGNSNIPKRTGEYAKKFYKKKIAEGHMYKRVRIGNRKYQITHLLEYGHITRSGGRTRAFPHWEQAQRIVDELPERVKRILEQ